MSLRTKCALLLIAFELTLAATLLFTVQYINVYFDNAANLFSLSSRAGVDLGRLRAVVRSELMTLQRGGEFESLRQECDRFGREIDANARSLRKNFVPPIDSALMDELDRRLETRADSVRDYLAGSGVSAGEVALFDPDRHLAVDEFLGELESRVNAGLRTAVQASFEAQQRATVFLSINMIVAAAIGILGMILVRRWVLLPIRELTNAADEFGKGRLEHRARVTSRDEMGRLADALNRMSSDLSRIEQQMVLRERAAATGELISYVAHNIRNPLAGIRSLVDSCQRQTPSDSPLSTPHHEINAAIERLQRWLRELEHTCKPMEIDPRPVDIGTLVDNIIAVFKPMADRRGVQLSRDVRFASRTVRLDERHFEQAVAAVVGNAIEAVGEGGAVTIGLEFMNGDSSWCLSVADTGRGIPEELQPRIFDPSFSTKREGRGTGLAVARRVVELHGGRLTVECPAGGGTIFKFAMT